MAHRLADDRQRYILTVSRRRPRVSGDIRGELQVSHHLAQLPKTVVIAGDGIAIPLIDLTMVVGIGEDGEQVGGVGGIAVDNGLHQRLHPHLHALFGLPTDIGHDATNNVGLAHKGQIDKRETTGAEGEHEQIAGKLQRTLVTGQATAISF